ncbi:hypothetical protein TNCV_509811 [Trichonephila clavipes]|nr:hypothetical protein TNCV_509811 [Trichonephila clavipes]
MPYTAQKHRNSPESYHEPLYIIIYRIVLENYGSYRRQCRTSGRRRAVLSPRLEESILNVVLHKPKSMSTSFESGRLSSPPEILPVSGTTMCAAAGTSSCAEQLFLYLEFGTTLYVIGRVTRVAFGDGSRNFGHGQVTKTTPELAPPLLTTTPRKAIK